MSITIISVSYTAKSFLPGRVPYLQCKVARVIMGIHSRFYLSIFIYFKGVLCSFIFFIYLFIYFFFFFLVCRFHRVIRFVPHNWYQWCANPNPDSNENCIFIFDRWVDRNCHVIWLLLYVNWHEHECAAPLTYQR